MQGHCRSLYPFLDMAVVFSGVEAQANQFSCFPPYYRANSNRTARWQSESQQYRLRQRKLACVLQRHTFCSQLHTASGKGEGVSLHSDLGG
jgi:hypothetical protein